MRKTKNFSIKAKILITLLLISFLCLSISLAASYYISYKVVMQESTSKFINASGEYAENINGWLKEKGKIITQLSQDIDHQANFDPNYVANWLQNAQKNNPTTVDVYIGMADKTIMSGVGWVPDADYDCTQKDWYKQAVQAGKLIFTAPYLDAGTKKMVITIATPIHKNGTIAGVLALDIPIDELTTLVGKAKIGKGDYAFLIDNQKGIVVHPNKDFQPTEKESKKIDTILSGNLKAAASVSKDKNSNVFKAKDYDNADKYFAYAPVASTNWIIGFAAPAKEITEPLNKLVTGFMVSLAVSILLCLIIAPIVISSIIKPLQKLISLMKIASTGDLTVKSEYNKTDEIGELSEAFNQMINNNKNLIKQLDNSIIDITETAETLAATCEENFSALDEVSKTVTETTKGAYKQSENTQTTVIVTEALSQEIENISESVDNSIKYSNQVLTSSDKGLHVVDILNQKTQDNNAVIGEVIDVVNTLNSKIVDVQNILESINSISEQTNLLALNAAIEAARAGEAGKGFVVVAEEVRQLSESTQISSNNVNDILTSIKEDVLQAQEIMNRTKYVVKDQNQAVIDTKHTFDDISEGINSIVDKVNNINKNLSNIVGHRNSVMKSIQDISSISQDTSASLEEISAISEQQVIAVEQTSNLSVKLSGMTKDLEEAIKVFKI